jgi:hypothetical protein
MLHVSSRVLREVQGALDSLSFPRDRSPAGTASLRAEMREQAYGYRENRQ